MESKERQQVKVVKISPMAKEKKSECRTEDNKKYQELREKKVKPNLRSKKKRKKCNTTSILNSYRFTSFSILLNARLLKKSTPT